MTFLRSCAKGLHFADPRVKLGYVMGMFGVNLKLIVAAFAVTVLYSMPGLAGESALAPLYDALRGADEAEASQIEREIRLEWSKSGSAAMDVLLRRGRDALEVEDYPVAIEHLTALTDHAPNFAEGWHLRATAFFHTGKIGLALSDLEHALTLDPNHFGAVYGLAVIFEELGRPEDAFEAYQLLHSIHPHHENVSDALGRLAAQVDGVEL